MPNRLQKSFADVAQLQTLLVDDAWDIFKDNAGSKLLLQAVATHSGKLINNRIYRGPKVKDACSTWCVKGGAEFDRPYLRNHDQYSGEPMGRVIDASFKATVSGTRFVKDWMYPTKEGSGYITLDIEVTDADAIEKLLDGRYQTVSVGGSTDAAYCSICSKKNKDFVNMWGKYEDKDGETQYCEHIPGRMYGDSTCAVVTGNMAYQEISDVNVPADKDAKYIMKKMIQDSIGGEDSNLCGYFSDDEDNGYEILQLPTRFGILDAEGKPIRSLDVDRHQSKKTVSIPSAGGHKVTDSKEKEADTTEGKEGEEHSTEQSLTDEAFYQARILQHFSDLDMVDLTDAEKEEVAKLDTAELSDDQSNALTKVFMTHPSVPFDVTDAAEIKATRALIDANRLRCSNTEGWIKALDEQTNSNFSNSEDKTMGDEALKKALAAAQKTVEDMTAAKVDSDKKIADLQKQAETLISAKADLSDKLQAQTVDKVLDLRAELGYHDSVKLDDEKRKALRDSYLAKSTEVIDHLYADLQAQKQAGGFKSAPAASADVPNPLQDSGEQEEETTAPAVPTASKSIKDSQDF